jgi:argininosuccinate lyase
MQDDKRALFDAVDTMRLVLPALAGAVGELKFSADRMAAALSSTMMATDLADYLVRKGATFRDAHRAVGEIIRTAEAKRVDLGQLPLDTYVAAHPLFDADVFEALSPRASTEQREIPGGTGPNAVRDQIEAARATLRPTRETPRGNEMPLLAVG